MPVPEISFRSISFWCQANDAAILILMTITIDSRYRFDALHDWLDNLVASIHLVNQTNLDGHTRSYLWSLLYLKTRGDIVRALKVR